MGERRREGENENERGKIEREGGREEERNVKVTLFCLENQMGGQINGWLYLVLWLSLNEVAPSFFAQADVNITLKDFLKMKNAVICIICMFFYCGKSINKYTESLQSLPV